MCYIQFVCLIVYSLFVSDNIKASTKSTNLSPPCPAKYDWQHCSAYSHVPCQPAAQPSHMCRVMGSCSLATQQPSRHHSEKTLGT